MQAAGIVTCVNFSSDGKNIASGSYPGTIQVWNVDTGAIKLNLLKEHTSEITSVAFSSSGRYIVSGSQDGTIQMWCTKTGTVMWSPLNGHTNVIKSVAFSPDDRYIASASNDETIRVWNADKDITSQLSNNLSNITHPASKSDTTFKCVVPSGISSGSFTDDSILQNGWIINSSSEYLFWVPPWNRPGLCWPRTKFVVGARSTKVDLSRFKCGTSWEQCRNPVN
ncbi:WD40 repeat-like protein [Rickenella mellea]|uniref:WD40 repeat-like protein n=1 Tax=Rickenella mellea TaxID=50990 RepID=A0A4Y7PZ27_9AGAM|nr:WD40 repeat-like protein [Rickenella mellea]